MILFYNYKKCQRQDITLLYNKRVGYPFIQHAPIIHVNIPGQKKYSFNGIHH